MPISLKKVIGSGSYLKLGSGVQLNDFNGDGIGRFIYNNVDISAGANIVNLDGRWVVYAVNISGMNSASSTISCTITIDGVQKLNTSQTGYANSAAYIIGGRSPSNLNQVDIANRQGIGCDTSFIVNLTKAASTNCIVTLFAYPVE